MQGGARNRKERILKAGELNRGRNPTRPARTEPFCGMGRLGPGMARACPFFGLAEKRRVSVVSCIKWLLRAPQKIQVKAQLVVNGRSLNKGCNAGLSLLWGSLRAKREGIICGVTPLGKDMPFPARRALQLIPSRFA